VNYTRKIMSSEVSSSLKRMKVGKACGPDGIPIEVRKCLGDVGVNWLTRLFNKILVSKRMPNEWRQSTLVPIFKNKGDIQSCSNYRGIQLMSHTMKLWERVVEHRLRCNTSVYYRQPIRVYALHPLLLWMPMCLLFQLILRLRLKLRILLLLRMKIWIQGIFIPYHKNEGL
jgi:hypothetical protein